ncbi:hypothetical protein [Mammaliicoccus sciuri]|uniref:hypothetical protein n=1 Tax=Mammaliicoccus sciuri TaxID=1296 RepID=UPI00265C1CF0|nr:hypothetical protein [Mammaliicoccus sciuri]MDO0948204.1 hypothetical protein [Mammaliicoccus sciuri]MDO0953425.1 hypothetical protein [Mammaliicoccus sciuri]
MKQYNIEIIYKGVINETITAESMEEAEFEAQDIATMEVPRECDEYDLSITEVE